MDEKQAPYPYPLPEIDPAWRTKLVKTVAEHCSRGNWNALPALARLLEGVGCRDAAILDHLRKYEHAEFCFPNRNGGCWEGTCWVVRAILEKSQRVVAKWKDGENECTAPVVNPGDWWGMAWLVTHAVSYFPDQAVVEADNPGNAEDIWVESKLGVHARISDDELKDYQTSPGRGGENPEPPEYGCSFTGDGTAYDSESIQITGREYGGGYSNKKYVPFPCLYVGPGIPPEGVNSKRYSNRGDCEGCGKDCYPVDEYPYYDNGTYCSESCYIRAKDGVEPEPEAG